MCRVIRTIIDITGIISVSIIILMYIQQPYSKWITVAWALFYSLLTVMRAKKNHCSLDDIN